MGTNHNLGLAYLAMEAYEKAEACFLRELELFGENYSRCKVLADLYYTTGDAPKSLQFYQAAQRLEADQPDLATVKKRLAICMNADLFEKASSSRTLCKKGMQKEQAGEMDEALFCYMEAIKDDPTNILALNNAGACAQRQNDLKRAQNYFQQAHELSGFPAIAKNLKIIEAAFATGDI